jgi:hypothetical protein
MHWRVRSQIERAAALGLTLVAVAFLVGVFGRVSDARDGAAPAVRMAQHMPQAMHPPGGHMAKAYRVGALVITAPWARATPDGAKVAGGFMTIANTGKDSDFLIGGTMMLAGRFELHEMAMSDGVMKMRELPAGLEIKPGATVELKPGGYHVMFMDLRERLVEKTPVKGTLVFRHAGTIEIEYAVAPIGARGMPGH